MRKLFNLILLILILQNVSCRKEDKIVDKIEKTKINFLLSTDNWKYLIDAEASGLIGINGQRTQDVWTSKISGDKLDVYIYNKALGQQGDLYNFKIYSKFINDNSDVIIKESKFYISNQPEYIVGYTEYDDILALDDYPNDFFIITRTRTSAYYPGIHINDTSYNEKYSATLTAGMGGELIYAENKFFYGGATEFINEISDETEGLSGENDGLEICNDIASECLTSRILYYKVKDELQEIFISKEGFLSSAIMQKETTSKGRTTMVPTNIIKDKTYKSGVTILYKKQTDNLYFICIFSTNNAFIDKYTYNPINYKFSFVKTIPYENSITWRDINSNGTIYISTVSSEQVLSVLKCSGNEWQNIPINVLNKNVIPNADIHFSSFMLKHDILFGIVNIISDSITQTSVIQYIGE